MDAMIKNDPARQAPQREEANPLQEQEMFPIGMESDLSPALGSTGGDTLRVRCASRSAEQILAEQLAEFTINPVLLAPVFVP